MAATFERFDLAAAPRERLVVMPRLGSGLRLAVIAGSYLLVACSSSGLAQFASPESGQGRGGVMIGGKPAQGAVHQRCVEVEVGSERSFGCLNETLRREVDRVNPSFNMPPIDARSPDIRVGNANEAAIRLQYGPNYGRSAVPYRPATPTYSFPRR